MSRSSLDPARQTVKARAKSKRPVRLSIRPALDRQRVQINFNHDWLFCRSEAGKEAETPEQLNGQAWETVDLPHSVRLEPLNASGGRNFQGVCWYRKRVNIPAEWRGRVIYLQLEAAMQGAGVWLNGQKIAEHHCGYTPFTVDLSRLLRMAGAENLLTVRLDNRDNPRTPPGKAQRELDFAYFGGLYRNVALTVTDPLHITDPILEEKVAGGGVFATCPAVTADAADVEVRTEVRNEFLTEKRTSVRQELIDPNGKIVAADSAVQTIAGEQCADFIQSLRVRRPRLWHPDHPHLYRLRTTILDQGQIVDEQVTPIGIRHVRFDAAGGLFINHQRFRSIGANRHQDHPYVGYAMPDSGQRRDVKKLREAGFTSVRSHYPQSPAFMDACDELGMMAIVSNPGWQFIGDEVFVRRAVDNARRMVRRDRNRPSVILWEAALNESDNRRIGSELHQAVHEEYPGDQCHTAGDHQPPARWDVEYLHNDGTRPYFIREFGDHVDNWRDQQSRSRVKRGWGEAAMLVQASAHVARLNEVLTVSDRLAGACLWAGIDCQRGYHHEPFHGGVLDLFRVPKFNHYFFQSQRPPEVRVRGLDDGPMIFIATHDTFFSSGKVMVFSNCEEVRLLMDGQEVGRARPDRGFALAHPPFTFDVDWPPAEQSTMYMNCGATVENPPRELKAEGLINGVVAATHIVRPPGVAACLKVEADLCGAELLADRSDWLRVHASVRDARGTVCPFNDDWVTFAVDGEGALVGNSEIGSNPVQAEAGIATALVRSSGQPGRIVVTASAFGLAGGQVQIITGPNPTGHRLFGQ